MTASPLPDDLTSDCDWLVQAIDPRARLVRLVLMNQATWRAASFLDDRLLSPKTISRLCSLDQLVAAAGQVADPPAGWIFHIGHVGSTLVSRLLGELDVLAVREPRSLRDLAVADDDERAVLAHAVSRMMARRGRHRATIVKATSFVSDYAPLLVEPGARALFLYASPANYIAGILAGENSVREVAAMHDVRAGRLDGRGIRLEGFDRNDADRAALAWATEMTALEAAAGAMAEDVILWADFDRMLADMPGWIGRIATHFGQTVTNADAEALAEGPLMRRYSKAMEYDYSPSLRAELLAEAAGRHAADIAAAIARLRQAAGSADLLGRALQRADGEG